MENPIKLKDCKHVFEFTCIEEWVVTTRKRSCPCCRTIITGIPPFDSYYLRITPEIEFIEDFVNNFEDQDLEDHDDDVSRPFNLVRVLFLVSLDFVARHPSRGRQHWLV